MLNVGLELVGLNAVVFFLPCRGYEPYVEHTENEISRNNIR